MFAHGPGSKCRLGYWALFGLLMMPLASIAQTCATPPGLAWGQVQDDFGVKVAGPFVTGFAACAAIAPAITGVSDGAGGYLTFSVSSASPGGPPIANVQNEVLSCWLVGNSGNSSPYYGDAANAYPQAGGCPLYWIQVTLPGQCATCNGVGHPIDPATGNVYATETDIELPGGPGAIAFQRFYNSDDQTGLDIGPGWRHSYSRSINTVLTPNGAAYPGQSAIVSSQYNTPEQACASGFPQVQGAVSAWTGAAVSYSNNTCVLSKAGVTVATVAIQSGPVPAAATSAIEYDLIRDNGQVLRFTTQNGLSPQPGVSVRLAITGSGFTVTDDEDTVETYNASGVLQSVTTRAGVVQSLTYNSNGQLSGVTDSFGNALSITYNGYGVIPQITVNGAGSVQYGYVGYEGGFRLSTITNLDGTTTGYTYGNSAFPDALTALIDESGSTFSTWGYDSQERGTATAEAGGANAVSLVYNSNGSTTVTDALGAVRTFTYSRVGDVNAVTSISGSQCPSCQEPAATSYDAYGWLASRADYNGNVTCYANDPVRGLELVRVEGFAPGNTCPANLAIYTPTGGTLQRKITTAWSPTWREPALITEPNRTIGYTFYPNGSIETKTITDTTVTPNGTRTWQYTYNGYGQPLTITGPRTDLKQVTTLAYYTCTTGGECGQIETITDALGHVTTFNTYNAYGQPLTITNQNGVVSTLTYDARLRLTSVSVATGPSTAETTGYQYYATGLLNIVTLPDGTAITYGYDAAHRLTDITDSLGNNIHYTLDALGNHKTDDVYDPTNTLRRVHTRMFNALSQLSQDINAAGMAVATTLTYDAQGNLKTADAPLGRNTTNYYDALNRLDQITDPNTGQTYLGYDANNNLNTVKDPRGLTTTYTHNGFGDLSELQSPDSGNTLNTFDSAGNLKTSTDARGDVVTYTLDALNRVTQQAYADETIVFGYDNPAKGANGIGRLTSASDASHALSWTYDDLGRVSGKGQTVAGVTKSVGYGYSNGDLVNLVTPWGQKVVYSYTNHQITGIAVNGTTLLSGVTYFPYGGVSGWTWGNGTTVARTYDQDGKITSITTAGDTVDYGYDNAFRITSVTDTGASGNSWSLPTYDLLDRLESASKSGTSYGWTYDANGNRLTQTGTTATTLTPATTSNELTQTTGGLVRTYAYDGAGNTKSYGTLTFAFDDRGRMSAATNGSTSASYIYNAVGQLIEKTVAGYETVLMYDESGHLLGEYTSYGVIDEETIWMGDIPVATLRRNGTTACTTTTVCVFYVHTDQLNAPRKISQPSTNTLAWQWGTDPFGTVAPAQNPGGLGTFVYNLRFPGQYYQAETGVNYNYFRDYDPQTGRYVESDPIGLKGGINTYAYAFGNPLTWSDWLGLKPGDVFPTIQAAAIDALDYVYQIYPNADREYAGSIFPVDGGYSATDPNPGTQSASSPSWPAGGGDAASAIYHTHGQCTPGKDNDNFSRPDSQGIQSDTFLSTWYQIPNYLETPGGIIKRYDPGTTLQSKGHVTTIRKGTACTCSK
jgi:RHS repeat-associated protein